MHGRVLTYEDYLVAPTRYIYAGEDLNDYLTAGRYCCDTYSTATQVANMPPGGATAGTLIVSNPGGYTRRITTPNGIPYTYFVQWYITVDGNVYMRNIHTDGTGNVTYEEWYKLAKELATK